MQLTDDKTVASLEITGTFDAVQLEALMRQLALLRAQMEPAVPGKRAELGDDGAVLVEDKPTLHIGLRRQGGFRLWLRHRGYGWLAYQLDERSATGMAAFVLERSGASEVVDFIAGNDGNRH